MQRRVCIMTSGRPEKVQAQTERRGIDIEEKRTAATAIVTALAVAAAAAVTVAASVVTEAEERKVDRASQPLWL
jgi:hypothetical protein